MLVGRGFPEKSKEVQREFALEQFQEGLLNPVTKRELQGRAPLTLGEAVRRVEAFDFQEPMKREGRERLEEPQRASSSRFPVRVPWRPKPQSYAGAVNRWQKTGAK
ncbi:unnamed protein product [Echinostoma caproni]|uniref:LEM domain-containing protein n=1 Tax=Echinostoma caproni TaxID=27848 RepID=A0A183B8B7_9TREM|nr:unnamed protein product [Echinostoma caproni]